MLTKPAGFYAFKAFPDKVFEFLKGLKSSASMDLVRNARAGISSTVTAGTMTGSGAQVLTGAVQADSYGYYAHHKTSSVLEIAKLFDIALASIYCYYPIT